jgi:hypothetical protein
MDEILLDNFSLIISQHKEQFVMILNFESKSTENLVVPMGRWNSQLSALP